jgi:hypothetical protein
LSSHFLWVWTKSRSRVLSDRVLTKWARGLLIPLLAALEFHLDIVQQLIRSWVQSITTDLNSFGCFSPRRIYSYSQCHRKSWDFHHFFCSIYVDSGTYPHRASTERGPKPARKAREVGAKEWWPRIGSTKPAHQGREIIVLHKNFHIFHKFLHKIHVFQIAFHNRVPQSYKFCGPNALV